MAYTILSFLAYFQGHIFSPKILLHRTLNKLPKFFLLSLVQSIIVIAPLYISFLLLSCNIRWGSLLGVAGGIVSIGLFVYLVFMKYGYLVEGGICPSIIADSWRLVRRIGRRKVANKLIGIRGMVALVGLVYTLFILPLSSRILPSAPMILYPLFAGLAGVWTAGALTETYLTYKEKLPNKGEDATSVSFWIATVILAICYFLAAWMLLMMTSLSSMFLKYGTTTSKRELPQQVFTQAQQEGAQKNIATISTLFTQEKATTAVFSQEEINAMIAEVP